MSPEMIREAAKVAHETRRRQLIKLIPTYQEACNKQKSLINSKESFKVVKDNVETMSKLINIPNFFPTPKSVIDEMLLHINLSTEMNCLEPSAGKGDLARVMAEWGAKVDCIELNYNLCDILRKENFNVQSGNFLEIEPTKFYDLIMMNPPFDHGSAVKHIRHAFKFLANSGNMAAVCTSTDAEKLKEWANDNNGYVINLPENSFKLAERSTMVNTALVIVKKIN